MRILAVANKCFRNRGAYPAGFRSGLPHIRLPPTLALATRNVPPQASADAARWIIGRSSSVVPTHISTLAFNQYLTCRNRLRHSWCLIFCAVKQL